MFLLCVFAACKVLSPVYTPIGDVICTNFFVEPVGFTDTKLNKFSATGVTTKEGYSFVVDSCDTFHWGMGTTNENPVVLGPGDKLLLWIDDATNMGHAPNGIPNEAAQQLALLANSSGWIPKLEIYDKRAMRRCDHTPVIFNEAESVWEVDVDCGDVFEYELRFGNLDGFFIHASNDPVAHALVYPPVPSAFQLGDKETTFTDFNIAQNPCRPSLTARIKDDILYVTPSYYTDYYKTNYTGAKAVTFSNDWIVILKGTTVLATNFMNLSQKIEVTAGGDQLRASHYCGIGVLENDRDDSLGDVVLFTKGSSKFQHLELGVTSTSTDVNVPSGETILDITAGLSSQRVFFVLTKKDTTFVLRKWTKSHGFEDFGQPTNLDGDSFLYWSLYGYLFIVSGESLYLTTDTALMLTSLEKVNVGGTTDYGKFTSIHEDSSGRFLLQTSNGYIFLYFIDTPVLTRIETTFDPKETIVVEKDTFLLVGSTGAKIIPVTSELKVQQQNYASWCPLSVTEQETFDSRVILDKQDSLTYKAYVVSENEDFTFRIQKSPVIVAEVNTTTFPTVRLDTSDTSFSPVIVTQFEARIRPLEPGLGKIVIHTNGYGWMCGLKSRVADVMVGCPLSRNIRIRGGNKTSLFYSSPYYRPTIDVYDGDTFIGEYLGKLYASSPTPFIYSQGDDFLMANTTNRIQLFDSKAPYYVTFTTEEGWSYCNLSVTAEITLETPAVPYYVHSLTGFLFYLILTVAFCIAACYVPSDKKAKSYTQLEK